MYVEPNVKLFVQDWGSGKPIVFIHGWPYSHAMFEYQYEPLLERGIRCIGIDLRGFGNSDKPRCNYSFDLFADDLYQVLQQIELEDATLLGFSAGGAVAVRYMAKYAGAKIAKLALVSASTPCLTKKPNFPQGKDPSVYNEFIEQIKRDRPQTLANFGQSMFDRPISPALANWFTSMAMQASVHATISTLAALRDADLRSDLAKINVPTVIMHSVNDQKAPLAITAAVNYTQIKNSELIRFEHSGHGLFLDEKAKFNQELINFIS